MKISGIHHITGISRHPQENIDFYASLLGLRMIKKTVNFDNPNTYHFYYGNDRADIGTILTFFPSGKNIKQGAFGSAQARDIILTVPFGSLSFWEERLTNFKVEFYREFTSYETFTSFKDLDGIKISLVESDLFKENTYSYNGIPEKYAIKGIYGTILYSKDYTKTSSFLENILNFTKESENSDYIKYETNSDIGKYIYLKKEKIIEGKLSLGAIHHVAFSIEEIEIEKYRKELINLGLSVSDVKDRNFFKSIYFKEPGGIIVELASKDRGFKETDISDRGDEFYLPDWFRDKAKEIEEKLIPVHVKKVDRIIKYPYYSKEEYQNYKYHNDMLEKINELENIRRTRELTKEELEIREKLRNKYVENITKGVIDIVNNIKISDEKDIKNIKYKGEKVQ